MPQNLLHISIGTATLRTTEQIIFISSEIGVLSEKRLYTSIMIEVNSVKLIK